MSTLPAESTETRLLEAAARIFALKGIEGASTREIAREAGVNEVTLFRKFGNKDGLLAAVVENIFGLKAKIAPEKPISDALDLRSYLVEYVRIYSEIITTNLPLIRTMVGEIHRFQDHERQVFHAVFRPLRQMLAGRLDREKASRGVTHSTSSEMVVDQLNGMIFMDVLRRSSTFAKLKYSSAAYRKSCVEMVLATVLAEVKK
ncbi:MAG: TetR/AcrR family transcriptional regulator [Chthoniobacterales bacterium]